MELVSVNMGGVLTNSSFMQVIRSILTNYHKFKFTLNSLSMELFSLMEARRLIN